MEYWPASAVIDHADSPASIERVHFDNIIRTKYDALVKEIRHVFSARTLGDVMIKAVEAKNQMERDGLFDYVIVKVDVSRQSSKFVRPDADPNAIPLELIFSVQEPGRIKASVSTGVTNRGEVHVHGDTKMKSVFGRGEVLQTDVSVGSQKTSLWNLSFIKPLLGWRATTMSWNIWRQYYEQPVSAYNALQTGVSMDLSHQTFANLRHTLRLSGEWRQLSCLTRAAPWLVREQSGHSLKVSLYNIIKYSTVDSEILPQKGVLARAVQEWAGGLGGNVRFLRHDFEVTTAAPLLLGFFLSPSLRFSYVHPTAGASLSLIDRTFLGGSTDLRGFAFNGIGPSEDGAFVGGMASFAAALHLYRQLYFKTLFFHAFAATGNLAPVRSGFGLQDAARMLADRPRYSLGVGLAFKILDAIRLEVNMTYPISDHPMDAKQPGIQAGVGVSFL